MGEEPEGIPGVEGLVPVEVQPVERQEVGVVGDELEGARTRMALDRPGQVVLSHGLRPRDPR